MEAKIKNVFNDYNKHAAANLPSIFFTVMLWIGAQSLITEGAKQYLPSLATWQLAAVEVFIASYGLWYFSRRKNEPESKTEVVT